MPRPSYTYRASTSLSFAARLTTAGLVATGIGFVAAGINPGSGPRVVNGAMSVGLLYLPPLLVGLSAWALAALVATGIRWLPVLGAFFALVMLMGSATLGSAAMAFRLSHPDAVLGFAEDTLQLTGELLAAGAGIVPALRLTRHRLPSRPGA
jgi:hypothetical protein